MILIIAELKKHYPNGHHTKGYKDVQNFMKQNYFEHRQGSGYRSLNPLSDIEVMQIAADLNKAFPWFGQCINKFDVTDVGDIYDLVHMFTLKQGYDEVIDKSPI